MSPETAARLFGYRQAFDSPVVLWFAVVLALVLAGAGLALTVLTRAGKLSPGMQKDLWPRYTSWLWLAALMLGPILLGTAWVIAAVALLSLLCYREFARATGLFREKAVGAVAVLGIATLTFACADNWSRLYFAAGVLTVGLLAIVTIPQDRPKGYTQRTALGVMGFLLFGYCFGYLGMLANHPDYRPMLILVLAGTELNDVFAYCVGKTIGGPKLLPGTSPGKTVAGSAGALVLTTLLVAGLGHFVFEGTTVDRVDRLLLLGAGVSVLGQFGDLLLSSIKRDVGIKDIGATIPGHGGLLDRFDSLVLVPPAFFHFLSLYLGPLNTAGAAERVFTGGG
jgi:phosphatidate cytidylyltransferase